MKPKTCCITGHRIVEESKVHFIKSQLKIAITEAILQGYTHFISGFADGVDLYFAEIVSSLKDQYPLSLEAALPYRSRSNKKDVIFRQLLKQCDMITVYSEQYRPNCFLIRNRAMVQSADLVIAVYDGREKGGTVTTMRYAYGLQKEVKLLLI